MPFLKVKEGPSKGTEIRLRNEAVKIGRSRACQIRIAGDRISRDHAQIEPADGGFVLSDLKSSNGTFVNGERISEKLLKPGDEVRIGITSFRIEEISDDVEGTTETQALL